MKEHGKMLVGHYVHIKFLKEICFAYTFKKKVNLVLGRMGKLKCKNDRSRSNENKKKIRTGRP